MALHRLWKYISFSDNWKNCDTSLLDDIAPSWFARREVLQANSKEYEDFINKLKRRHAIETGIVERMYDIDKGVTETLINEGFISSLVSHGDTNIPKQALFNHLQDHLDAVDFIFDIVKDDRPLTKGFICELHQLTTRHQEYAEGRDQFGNKTKIPLIKGRFKEHENNPTRDDGTTILYCPPEHVEAEMDRLIEIYNELNEQKISPLITATWVHHAFTTIHPFQDGNGRVVRLVASLILIKNNYFPITVLREEAKVKYIQALEEADFERPQKLVTYFAEIQKRNIEEALNIKEVSNTSLNEVTNIFKQKILEKQREKQKKYERMLADNRLQVFEYCNKFLNEYKRKLEAEFDESVSFYIGSGNPNDATKQHYYYEQIVSYANKHNYYFNRTLPKAYFKFGIRFDSRKYELGITLHHFGYDDSVIAIGAFLEYKGILLDENSDTTIPLDIKPHVISIKDEISSKEKNIRLHLENILTVMIAQIASEI
ncbi:Fic family protein [Runella slithyformis]|uniref:Filamentation induced by cAMP protein Fic n=1 Tax=Runella slithyformis (strain ATCC 29530 / DSM 19594 / LMG 11500 / NCIMB 11436 / LSU 4) TaxID=761193 RepID=A0A7U4E459_RUNSL|nr:Fic family protein [Runella slithyformis]AEI46944.1 filamentation induced by cAMP protein Fic [Runella slithyformis DSM 19594]